MLDCVICLQLMKPPVKVLSCGHSFCLCCVRQIRRHSPLADSKRVKMACPTCRQETRIPRGRPSLLPNNYALHDILDKLQQQQVPHTDSEPEESCKAEKMAANDASSSVSALPSTVTYQNDQYYESEGGEWWDDGFYEDGESEYDSENWYCPNEYCVYYNFSFRHACRYCRTPRSFANYDPWLDRIYVAQMVVEFNHEQTNTPNNFNEEV